MREIITVYIPSGLRRKIDIERGEKSLCVENIRKVP